MEGDVHYGAEIGIHPVMEDESMFNNLSEIDVQWKQTDGGQLC